VSIEEEKCEIIVARCKEKLASAFVLYHGRPGFILCFSFYDDLDVIHSKKNRAFI